MKNKISSLKQRTEEFLNKNPEVVNEITSTDVKKLFEDLHIHQIELEIQNEELRRAQLELEASRDRYSELYDFAPVGYVTISENGSVLQANLSCSSILGVERSSLIGKPFSRFINKKDQDVFYLHRKTLIETKTKQACELRLVRKDRTQFYARLESVVVKDTKEGIGRCLTTITDINERKLSEKALKESEEKLRLAVEGGQLGIWNRNLVTGEVEWNLYLYELLGRDPNGPAINGNTFFTYIHPDDIERVSRHVDKTFRNGTDFFDEFRVVRNDGKIRWLGASGRVYRDPKGRPVKMAGVNYDITDRKQAEERVRQNETRFRSFIELTGQFGWTTDAEGKIREDLTILSTFTGLDQEDLKDWGWLKAIHPDDRECTERAWRWAVAEKCKYETEYRIRRFDGEYRHFLARGVPILKDDGSVEEWVGICIDISERKELESLLERSYEELEKRVHERTSDLNEKKRELEILNKELLEEIDKRKKFEVDLKDKGEKVLAAYRQRDFLSKRLVDLLEKERHEIGSTLHDHIGQILTGVNIELEGLKKIQTGDGSELSDRLEYAQALLRDAITQARNISHNLRSDVLEKFGLIDSVRQLIKEMEKQSHFKIHLFTKNIPEDLKKDGKDLTIYRLIQEALTNITKHARAKEIFINITQKDKCIRLTIEDDGTGFDYDTLHDQKNPSRVPLGIIIMRERVSMLGGEFRIESQPGRGTYINAQIPLVH